MHWLAAHVAMRYQANRVRAKRAGEHAARLQPRCQLCRSRPRRQSENHDVGLNRFEIDCHAFGVRSAPPPAGAHWRDLPRAAPARLRAQSARLRPAHPPASCRRLMLSGKPAPSPSVPPKPTSIDPTGAPSPFDRQNITVSKPRVNAFTFTPSATAALKMRAPSRCMGSLRVFAPSQISSKTSRRVSGRRQGWPYFQFQSIRWRRGTLRTG